MENGGKFTLITLVSSSGTTELQAKDKETILDCLHRYGVPFSSVCILEQTEGGIQRPISASSVVRDARGKLYAYANRNIQLLELSCPSIRLSPTPEFATEYLASASTTDAAKRLVQLSRRDVVALAVESITEVVKSLGCPLAHTRFVVGCSGGGDSNLLVASLLESGLFTTASLLPVMVLGIPDWDRQLPVAQQLTADYGLTLNVIPDDKVAALLAIDSISKVRERFSSEFPTTALDFLGTWLLRSVLSKYAELMNVEYVILGGNREDVLAEALYQIARGSPPLPFPFRTIGSITFVNPLYRLPKRVIDGAFNRYSVQNYSNRHPSYDKGRSLFYYLAYLLEDYAPGLDLTLLEGMRKLCSPASAEWDPDLADYVHVDASNELRERWKRVLYGHKQY